MAEGWGVREHLQYAMDCLNAQPGQIAGPSGVRAEAIAHIRIALLKLDQERQQAIDDFVAGVLA